jgi:hypothetical protein
LIKGNSNQYTTRIFMDEKYELGFEYYLEASDGLSSVFSGSDTAPHIVSVHDYPTIMSVSPTRGEATGGQVITVSGSNFKEGAEVYLGAQKALNITFVDANTLTATVPAHYPSFVNVKVVNPTGDESVLPNGFEYYSNITQLQIPTVKGMVGQEILVPVNVNQVTGLISAEFRVDYDASVLQYVGFLKGTIATRFTTVINSSTSGIIRVAMASDTNISGGGDLLYLKFKVLIKPLANSDLSLSEASFNGDSIPVETISGRFQEDVVYTISGTIVYYTNSEKVQNVRVVVEGEKQYISITTSNGQYIVQEIEPGSYTMTLEKRDEIGAISAYDASLVLRKAAGLDTLSAEQSIAGDVNGDGNVNSFDAALILQFAAGLRVLPFEGRTNIWYFSQNNMELTNLANSIENQLITAILIGDVSGNYSQSVSGSVPLNVIRVEQIQLDKEEKTIVVPIGMMTQEDGIYSIETTIRYNPALQVDSIVFSSQLDNYFKVVNTNVPGVIRIVIAGIDPISIIETMAKITFKTTAFAEETYYFDITNTRFNENEAVEMIRNAANTVHSPDINNDGVVDETDLEILLEAINKSHQDDDISGLDFNNDGIVDIYDIIAKEQAQ